MNYIVTAAHRSEFPHPIILRRGQALVVGILADLIAANRKLVQETLSRVRALQIEAAGDDDDDDPMSHMR